MTEGEAAEAPAKRLRQLVATGSTLGDKLTVAAANAWVMRTRGVLGHIYGKDSREVNEWCPALPNDRDRTPQEKLRQRLPKLERLLRKLQPPEGDRIFIGHGRSAEWLKLQGFLSRDLGLLCDEFNLEPTAGIQTTSRIESMLSSATMAFLIMTAEDQHADGTWHARQNVVHEVGLFQASLGARRAIVLLERGCQRFSNLDGLTTIDFPAGDVMARSEDMRRVLSREGIL